MLAAKIRECGSLRKVAALSTVPRSTLWALWKGQTKSLTLHTLHKLRMFLPAPSVTQAITDKYGFGVRENKGNVHEASLRFLTVSADIFNERLALIENKLAISSGIISPSPKDKLSRFSGGKPVSVSYLFAFFRSLEKRLHFVEQYLDLLSPPILDRAS